jgi:hypothetical protein
MAAWQRMKKNGAHGKENIDSKAVSRLTAKPPNTAKHKRHGLARLCLMFLINARQNKSLPSVLRASLAEP